MIYRVGCIYEVSSELLVEAESEEEAEEKARQAFDPADHSSSECYFCPEEVNPGDLCEGELREIIK